MDGSHPLAAPLPQGIRAADSRSGTVTDWFAGEQGAPAPKPLRCAGMIEHAVGNCVLYIPLTAAAPAEGTLEEGTAGRASAAQDASGICGRAAVHSRRSGDVLIDAARGGPVYAGPAAASLLPLQTHRGRFDTPETPGAPPRRARREGPASWEACVTSFREWRAAQGHSARTLSLDMEALHWLMRHLPRVAGELPPPAGVCAEHLVALVGGLLSGVFARGGQPVVPRTVNLKRTTWRLFFGHLVARGWIPANPARALKKLSEEGRGIMALDARECRALKRQPDLGSEAGFRDRTWMDLVLDTGLRPGESLVLRNEHIDLQGRVIRLRPEDTKTHKARTVPFSAEVATKLAELSRSVLRQHPGAFPRLFVTHEGGPMTPQAMADRLHGYARKAGIQRRVVPYSLRHTFARLWIRRNGADPGPLGQILGDDTLAMVRVYCRIWGKHPQDFNDPYSLLRVIGE